MWSKEPAQSPLTEQSEMNNQLNPRVLLCPNNANLFLSSFILISIQFNELRVFKFGANFDKQQRFPSVRSSD